MDHWLGIASRARTADACGEARLGALCDRAMEKAARRRVARWEAWLAAQPA